MDLQEFAQFHLPALEADEIRFNVQIAIISAAVEQPPPGFSYWTLGAPGHCAIKSPGRAILLGKLDRTECQELAKITHGLDCPGVVGADETARWFAEHATAIGAKFGDDFVVFENVRYGNALYIMFEQWQTLSQRSRIELLRSGVSDEFQRIEHREGWEDILKALVQEYRKEDGE